MYNLSTSSLRAGNASAGSTSGSYITYYTVSPDGDVDMPILGKIAVAGLNRTEIAEKVKGVLTSTDQGVKDAVVSVDFVNLYVGVLGEVNSRGLVTINRDKFTILDAIARAGDLTQYGNRKNVKVFRKNGTEQTTFQVDLTNYKELCASPVYMLQQDDIIYVEPNKVRARQSTTVGNTLLTPTFWISAMTLAMTMANFFK
jgi:polysaccharide export outer membrane protein